VFVVLTALVAGLVLVLAYPPTGWAWLAVPAVAAFLAAVRRSQVPSQAWAAGLVFGLAFFGFLFPWLAELGVIALLPLLIVQAAFPTVYAGLLFRARRLAPVEWILVAAAGWALMEAVKVRFPLGGFGWGLLGYPVGEWESARQAAQWIGTSGWSVVLVAAAAALSAAAWKPMVATVAVALSLAIAGGVAPVRTDGPELSVAIVQGSSPCPGTHCPNERRQVYLRHLELTRTLEPPIDLLVWPEGSTGSFNADPVLDDDVAEEMGAEALRLGAVFLAGGDRPISDTEWINANVVFDRSGPIIGEYRKQHPVPFGEYIPGRPLFEWIPALAQVPRDMIRGDGPVLFPLDGGQLGSVISFEGSFARYARQHVRAGADLVVVATSQASYPFSYASDQLIGMTQMRSAELGVDVVHASVSGRSILIVDGGDVGERTPLSQPATLTGTVQLRDAGPTLYTLAGDWVQLVALLAGVAVLIRQKSHSEQGR